MNGTPQPRTHSKRMLTARVEQEVMDRVDAAVSMRPGWTRTIWLLRAIGDALARDEYLFGETPEQADAAAAYRRRAVLRTEEWRRQRAQAVLREMAAES